MTRAEKLLTVYFLEKLSDIQGNAGCNDLDSEIFMMLSDEEQTQLAAEYGPYNGTPEEKYRFDHMMDFMLVGLLAHKLKQEAENEG